LTGARRGWPSVTQERSVPGKVLSWWQTAEQGGGKATCAIHATLASAQGNRFRISPYRVSERKEMLMNIAAIANRRDFALPTLLTTITLSYICMAGMWLSQLM